MFISLTDVGNRRAVVRHIYGIGTRGPVRAIHRTASMNRRLSAATPACWPGRRSLIRSQSAPEIARRCAMAGPPWHKHRASDYPGRLPPVHTTSSIQTGSRSPSVRLRFAPALRGRAGHLVRTGTDHLAVALTVFRAEDEAASHNQKT